MRATLPTAAVLLLATAGTAAGQRLVSPRFQAAERAPDAFAPSAATPAPTTEDPRDEPRVREGGGLLSFSSVVHAIGGAIVGGWVGYVGAQVVKSDWDKENNGSFSHQRSAWVAGGMVIGLLGSRLIGRTSAPRPGPLEVTRPRRNRSVLTAAEIADANVDNAFDLILNLRKEWLVTRGTNSWAESPRGQAEGFGATFQVDIRPGRDRIIVYLDDIRVGGVEDMKEISKDLLTRAEFIDARRATYLYGAGHSHGVIRLSSEMGAP